MPYRSRAGLIAAVVAGSLALGACASKAPKVLPPIRARALPGGSGMAGGTGLAAPGSQADFVNFTRGADVIYFDTDRYKIDSVDAAALATQAQWLARYPAKRATIEGHADERGTRDYNLALGERRANATKNYLVGLGVDPARLSTVSYGKERPVALGSTEEAWAQNRRAVTVTID